MTILEMIAERPALFYRPVPAWWEREAFVTRHAVAIARMPSHVVRCPVPPDADELTDAASLVALYVEHPHDAVWADYLWTGDVDAEGQRVYLGGTANGRGLELHRHLAITDRWRVPVWH